MSGEPIEESLGAVLGRRRRDRFVGRDAELGLVRSALEGDGTPFAVLHVHGPGGIGKTSLVARIAELGRDAGAHVVRLDARDVAAVHPDDVLASVGRWVEVPETGPIAGADGRRLLVLVDGYERLEPLDGWVRDHFVPRLAASSLVVVAGRNPPGPEWRADPAWRDLLRVVALRNLEPSECDDYLASCGVPEALRPRLAAVSHGHPLALTLLTDLVVRGHAIDADPMSPDLVGTLLARFLDSAPGHAQRRALAAAVLARVTTESLLREVVGGDAHDLFAWLRELSFVEATADGLAPHSLARDALDADLRWRDPAMHREVFRGVRDHICREVTSRRGAEQRRAIHDLKYLFRVIPGILSPVDWDVWGDVHPEPARPDDRDAVLALVSSYEGDEAARIAARWWDSQPEGFVVIRDAGAVAGVIGLIDLTATSAADLDADPGARAAWEHAHRQNPPRAGERVTQTRIIVDRDEHQRPSPTLNLVPVVTLQRYLEMPDLAWDFLTLAEPDQWDEYFALADLPRADGADFQMGPHRFGLFAHDFRAVPVDALITLWTERALAQGDDVEPPERSPETLVLSHTDFREAVRQALRDLHRPDLLERNPLRLTRLARDAAGPDTEPDAETVEALIVAGIDSLRRDPRDDKRLRAIDRTYRTGAPSQEAASEVLGLPSSTYRRHLSQGVDRIVAWLWDREIYGSAT